MNPLPCSNFAQERIFLAKRLVLCGKYRSRFFGRRRRGEADRRLRYCLLLVGWQHQGMEESALLATSCNESSVRYDSMYVRYFVSVVITAARECGMMVW